MAEVTAAARPLYLTDVILGLRSDDFKRYEAALEHLPSVIEKSSNDLIERASELLQALFRT